jgi:transposase
MAGLTGLGLGANLVDRFSLPGCESVRVACARRGLILLNRRMRTRMTILYEMDTVERFPTVKDFASYCRLVKGSVSSAGKLKGLRGGKLGNPYLRWAFGEAAVIAKRSHGLIKALALKLERRHGKYKANAILANKLARAVYYMLKNGTAFDLEKLTASAA